MAGAARLLSAPAREGEPPPASGDPRRRAMLRRIMAYLAIAAAILFANALYRRWAPERAVETPHFRIESTASEAETREVGAVAEALYSAYGERFAALPTLRREHPRLQARLYRDRDEFRRCNPRAGWAEAFYQGGVCHQYYARGETNPYHWALHEGTHQLSAEVAGLRLPRWLGEGLATYCGASRLVDGALRLGEVDANAYPIWWLPTFALTGDPAQDAKLQRFIPLETLIADHGGPPIDAHFNLYYAHWWSLTHFLLHGAEGRYADAYLRLLAAEGTRAAFEEHVGPIPEVEPAWYAYLRSYVSSGERYRAIGRGKRPGPR